MPETAIEGLARLCGMPPRVTEALLLYRGDGNAALATRHVVEDGQIGAGRCLTHEDLARLARELAGGSGGARTILPAHVLYADGARLLWWRPASRRPAFFNTGRKEFDGELRGKSALYPALLFMALPQALWIWALADDARPAAGTPLYRAPVLNVYASGHMCAGTAKLPLELTTDTAPWERAFFETTFTHSNLHGAELTRHPGGHDALWRRLANPRTKRFDPAWLVELPGLTAGRVLGDPEPRRL